MNKFIDIPGEFKRTMESLGHEDPMVEEFSEILRDLIDKKFPEIAAMNELRGQINPMSWRDRVSEKFSGVPKYSKKSGVDPIDFLRENYKEYLKDGNVNAAQIAKYDQNLSKNLAENLRRNYPDIPSSISDLLERESGGRPVASLFKRRIKACATILGMDEHDTAKFLSNIRSDRVR